MFAIVLQHCPKYLMQRLKSNPQYYATNSTKDIIALTRMIRDASHAHDDTTQGTMAIVSSNVSMYITHMSKTEKPLDFCCTFQATVDTINNHGGCAGHHPHLVAEYGQRLCKERGQDPETCNPMELKEVMDDAECMSCKEYLLCLFILVADGGRFQGLTRSLNNQYIMDKDSYPTTMNKALRIIEKYKAEVGTTNQNADSSGESGVAFAQADAWQSNTTCYSCGERGHGVNDCPKLDDAQREKFWADRKATYTARKAKKGVTHAAFAEEAVAATTAPPPSVASEQI